MFVFIHGFSSKEESCLHGFYWFPRIICHSNPQVFDFIKTKRGKNEYNVGRQSWKDYCQFEFPSIKSIYHAKCKSIKRKNIKMERMELKDYNWNIIIILY